MTSPSDLTRAARAVLAARDHGGYTLPAAREQPHQRTADSTLVAMAYATFDVARAYRELEMMAAGQWDDGMIAQITFHAANTGSASATWHTEARTRGRPRTSGFTDQPVFGTALRRVHEAALRRRDASLPQRSYALFHACLKWHRWWLAARDPDRSGVVAILNPSELGCTSPSAKDENLAQVASDRGFKSPLDRLIDAAAATGWDADALWRAASFKVADVQTTALLTRATEDLIALSYSLGTPDEQAELLDMHDRLVTGLSARWRVDLAQFCSRDLITDADITSPTAAGFSPLLALDLDDFHRARIGSELQRWVDAGRLGDLAAPLTSDAVEPIHTGRGPASAVMNWLLIEGLERNGLDALAARLRQDTLSALAESGFDATKEPLIGVDGSGHTLSRTAAAWLCLTPPLEPTS